MITPKEMFKILLPGMPEDTFGSNEDIRALGDEVSRISKSLFDRYTNLSGKRRSVGVSVACFVIAYKYVMGYDFDRLWFVRFLCKCTKTRVSVVRRLEGRILKGLEWRVTELCIE